MANASKRTRLSETRQVAALPWRLEDGQRRILMNTITAELIALDADTGAFCPDFGANGRVDLKIGLGDAPDPQYVLTSAPTLAGTTVVVGAVIFLPVMYLAFPRRERTVSSGMSS